MAELNSAPVYLAWLGHLSPLHTSSSWFTVFTLLGSLLRHMWRSTCHLFSVVSRCFSNLCINCFWRTTEAGTLRAQLPWGSSSRRIFPSICRKVILGLKCAAEANSIAPQNISNRGEARVFWQLGCTLSIEPFSDSFEEALKSEQSSPEGADFCCYKDALSFLLHYEGAEGSTVGSSLHPVDSLISGTVLPKDSNNTCEASVTESKVVPKASLPRN